MLKRLVGGVLIVLVIVVISWRTPFLSMAKNTVHDISNEVSLLKNRQNAASWNYTGEVSTSSSSQQTGSFTSSSWSSGNYPAYTSSRWSSDDGFTVSKWGTDRQPQIDTTPRIAYWSGKVNQHTDTFGSWVSDPDGTSGANLDTFTYCKKWYPDTIAVEPYKFETLYTFRRASNYEQGVYTNNVLTNKCVQRSSTTAVQKSGIQGTVVFTSCPGIVASDQKTVCQKRLGSLGLQILSADTNTIVASVTSSQSGQFQIDIPPGSYIVTHPRISGEAMSTSNVAVTVLPKQYTPIEFNATILNQ